MEPDFDQPAWKNFRIAHTLPPHYRGFILRGARVTHAEAPAGMVVIQDIIQPGFSIHFRVFNVTEPIHLPARQSSSFLVAFLAIRNSFHYFLRGLGNLALLPGQFALVHPREQEGLVEFRTRGDYQSLEVSWSSSTAEEALPYFPGLQSRFAKKDPAKSFYLDAPGKLAGAGTLDIAQSILKAPYDDRVSLLYFEHKVREYLLSLLSSAMKDPLMKVSLSTAEYERILSMAEKLRSHPDQKFPISELARQVQVNEMKLKMVFKELFGQGIFEYQLGYRMKEAHRLLEETDLTTKAVAAMVGYRLTTSFITRFREYFGYPPSAVTRNK